MNSHFNLTINELPKTKKMQIDEQHPILKIKQNVRIMYNYVEIHTRLIRKN